MRTTRPPDFERCVLISIVALFLSIGGAGCTRAIFRVGVAMFYKKAPLPADQVVLDVPYYQGTAGKEPKHKLDLFLPKGRDWPVMVFVHGGGWTSGDRALVAGGADVYRNIGRFYAAHGIGTAVISYRLVPDVTWHDQVEDVAQAVHWVHDNIGKHGGDPGSIFLAGHSAGAQLITLAALDHDALAPLGESPAPVCGLIPISGAAFDLRDAYTFSLGGGDEAYYAQRFAAGKDDQTWRNDASPIRLVDSHTPPTMIMYGEDEPEAFAYQADRFLEVLRAHHVPSRIERIPGEDHLRIVLALSRADAEPARDILDFIYTTPCHGSSGSPAAAAVAPADGGESWP